MSKHLYKFILMLMVSLTNNLTAQTFTLYGDRTFGGDLIESFPYIKNDSSNNIILCGSSNTDIYGDKTDPLCVGIFGNNRDIWVVKIDTSFNILWDKSIGGDQQEVFSAPQIYNDKIIFSCKSNSDSSCEKSEHTRGLSDYWVCMYDSSGNKIWDKTYGSIRDEYSPQIIRLPSNDFILAGTSEDTTGSGDKTYPNYGDDDYWILKLDSAGNKLWDKVYGGAGFETGIITNNYNSRSFSIINSTGNDFILAGTTNSPLSGTISDTSRGNSDVWIVKLNSAGNKIWDKRYGGSGSDIAGNIIQTDDGGYILCATTHSPQGLDVSDSSRGAFDLWIIKLDSVGNKQWDKRYGGDDEDYASSIEKAPGGGYWISGTTFSDSSYEVSEPSYGSSDYWILKIDASGNKLWDKRFGAYDEDISTSFIIMPDSSIFLCGQAKEGTSQVKTDNGKGLSDYWVVHFKYTDNNTDVSENINQSNLAIYPNPTSSKIILNINSKIPADVTITDIVGKIIYYKENVVLKNLEIDISSFNKGIYFIKAGTMAAKILKE